MFAEGDGEELNDLYNLVAGRSRSIEQFEWEWLCIVPDAGKNRMEDRQ